MALGFLKKLYSYRQDNRNGAKNFVICQANETCFSRQEDLVLTFSLQRSGQAIMWSGHYKDTTWYAGKVLLCVSLFSMFIRCFQIYLVFQYFGPKVYMMRKMVSSDDARGREVITAAWAFNRSKA